MWKKSLLSEIIFEKKLHANVAKYLTTYLGSIWFLYAIFTFIFGWIIINGNIFNIFRNIKIEDPFPFTLLMILTQMFAIFLSVIVLISQNRQSKEAEIRQQIEFEINVRAENEITKILHMVEVLHTRFGIAEYDRELQQMKLLTNIEEIKEKVEDTYFSTGKAM